MRVAGLFVVVSIVAMGQGATRAADTLVYDVTGNIDTFDFLIIHGSTLQWHHTDTGGAAVGRHSGSNLPTVISSTLNGVTRTPVTDWTPTWPNPVPAENRINAFSSVYGGLTPALPAIVPLSVGTSVVSGRGNLEVSQLPDAGNDYTLIVRFGDGFNGSADLRGLITVVTPEPASLGLACGVILLARRLRRRAGNSAEGRVQWGHGPGVSGQQRDDEAGT